MGPAAILLILTTALAIPAADAHAKSEAEKRRYLFGRLVDYVATHPGLTEEQRGIILVDLDRRMETGEPIPGILLHGGKWVQAPSIVEGTPPRPRLPENVEVFYVEAEEFTPHLDDTWMDQRAREAVEEGVRDAPVRELLLTTDLDDFDGPYAEEAREELQELQHELAGYYHWFCLPGCILPDSDPYGPHMPQEEAIREAWEWHQNFESLYDNLPPWANIVQKTNGNFRLLLDTAFGRLRFGPYASETDAEWALMTVLEEAEDAF